MVTVAILPRLTWHLTMAVAVAFVAAVVDSPKAKYMEAAEGKATPAIHAPTTTTLAATTATTVAMARGAKCVLVATTRP